MNEQELVIQILESIGFTKVEPSDETWPDDRTYCLNEEDKHCGTHVSIAAGTPNNHVLIFDFDCSGQGFNFEALKS